MVILIVGGNKQKRLSLLRGLANNISENVVRRSLLQPIKNIVSNVSSDKLTIIDKELNFVGDTLDFTNTNGKLLEKISTIKNVIDGNFDKSYMINHFNNCLSYRQSLKNTRTNSSVFIVDDIEKKEDYDYLIKNLEIISKNDLYFSDKNAISSVKEFFKKDGSDREEINRVGSFLGNQRGRDDYPGDILIGHNGNGYINSVKEKKLKIVTIVIEEKDESISSVYLDSDIKSKSDVNADIVLKAEDLVDDKKIASIVYDLIYKDKNEKLCKEAA